VSVPTKNVTVTVLDPTTNAPVVAAAVTARLTAADVYQGQLVARDTVSGVTDAAGQCVLALFPNVLGQKGTAYAFKVVHPTTGRTLLRTVAVVPNNDALLTDIAGNVSLQPTALTLGQSIAASLALLNPAPVGLSAGDQILVLQGGVAKRADVSTLQLQNVGPLQSGFLNLGLKASVAANALTISVKGSDGNEPSPTNPVRIAFRNTTASAGDFSVAAVTAPLSLVISSGSTLGMTVGIPARIWVVAFNDAGTVRLGVIRCISFGTDAKSIYPLGQFPIASSVAEGGVGGATSALTFYTGVAVASKPYTVLGYFSYETALATPGTWNALPGRAQLFGPGVPLPGTLIQLARQQFASVGIGTGIIASSDAVPQNTDGDLIGALGITFTPTSGCNVAEAEASANCASNSASSIITLAIFDTTSVSAKAVVARASSGANKIFNMKLRFSGTWLGTAALPVSLRIGADIASTTTLNGAAGARLYGGVLYSYLELRELMG
jgi:hypothetical protein